MADLTLEEIPREGEIVEVLYRLSRPTQTHLDLIMDTEGIMRRLRFNGVRVVQFQEEPPPVLLGIEVQDIREKQLRDLALWVSVAEGALTFWAKTVTEIAQPKLPEARPKPRDLVPEEAPLVQAEEMRAWQGIPRSSFLYRTQGIGGVLRGMSVGTRRYV